MYIVDATGDAWVWDNTIPAFENAGPIVGPQGEQGVAGPAGPTGPAGADGQQGIAGPTAVSADANNTSKLGTDGLLFTPAPDLTGYVPRTGGDMTGQLNFKGDGAVSFQFDNGFNFQGLSQSSALRYGTKSVLGFTENDVVAAVPMRILNAPVTDEHATNKKYVDEKFAEGAYLPLAGGTLTGMLGFTGSGTQPLRFGSEPTGNYNLTMLASEGGMQWQFNSDPLFLWNKTSLNAQKPLILAAAPTTDLGAANKKYVDDKVAAGGVSYTLPTASATVLGGVKIGSGLAIDANGVVSASGGTSGLPTTGGTMTGTIASPIATPMSFMNNYSLFSQNGGVSFRFGAADLIAFSSVGIINYKPMTTPASGIGVQFGSGGGYLSKGGSAGIGAYIGGALRWTFDSTGHTSTVPIKLPADPVDLLHAAPKQYVDGKPTIVSIPTGGTAPDASQYPNNTLLVEYTA
jgi:hypothetical protein